MPYVCSCRRSKHSGFCMHSSLSLVGVGLAPDPLHRIGLLSHPEPSPLQLTPVIPPPSRVPLCILSSCPEQLRRQQTALIHGRVDLSRIWDHHGSKPRCLRSCRSLAPPKSPRFHRVWMSPDVVDPFQHVGLSAKKPAEELRGAPQADAKWSHWP